MGWAPTALAGSAVWYVDSAHRTNRMPPPVVSLLEHNPCQDHWRVEKADKDPLAPVSAIERGDFPRPSLEPMRRFSLFAALERDAGRQMAPSVGSIPSQSAARGRHEVCSNPRQVIVGRGSYQSSREHCPKQLSGYLGWQEGAIDVAHDNRVGTDRALSGIGCAKRGRLPAVSSSGCDQRHHRLRGL